MGTGIGSSNFSPVSCLNKTYTCSGLSFSICEIECLRSSLPGTLAFTVLLEHCAYWLSPLFSICFTRKWIQINNCFTRKRFHWLIKNSALLKKKIGRKKFCFFGCYGSGCQPQAALFVSQISFNSENNNRIYSYQLRSKRKDSDLSYAARPLVLKKHEEFQRWKSRAHSWLLTKSVPWTAPFPRCTHSVPSTSELRPSQLYYSPRERMSFWLPLFCFFSFRIKVTYKQLQ